MRSHRTSAPEGFTLIEVALALALFAACTAAGLPIYTDLQSAARVSAARDEVVLALRAARARALHGESGIVATLSAESLLPNGVYLERSGDWPVFRSPDGNVAAEFRLAIRTYDGAGRVTVIRVNYEGGILYE